MIVSDISLVFNAKDCREVLQIANRNGNNIYGSGNKNVDKIVFISGTKMYVEVRGYEDIRCFRIIIK